MQHTTTNNYAKKTAVLKNFISIRIFHTNTIQIHCHIYDTDSCRVKIKFSSCWSFVVDVMQGVQLKKHIDATLGSGNLRDAVRLPPGEDLNEWLAVNSKPHTAYSLLENVKLFFLLCTNELINAFLFKAVDFFNQVNILYGTLMEFCTPTTCPTMSAGPK